MKRQNQSAFSLVEVIAAVAIIGIIAFLALPNIVAVKEDSERNLAIARAEGINMAVASYIQANGREIAKTQWTGLTSEDLRYAALAEYMAFAPAARTDYIPNGFDIDIPDTLQPLKKATLKITGETDTINY